MASGNYAKKPVSRQRSSEEPEITSSIPLRATRPKLMVDDRESTNGPDTETLTFKDASLLQPATRNPSQTATKSTRIGTPPSSTRNQVTAGTTKTKTQITRTQTTRPRKLNPSTDTIVLPESKAVSRPTRRLPAYDGADEGLITTSAVKMGVAATTRVTPIPETQITRNVDMDRALRSDIALPTPLKHHEPWLKPWILSVFVVITTLMVLISAGIYQRSNMITTNYGAGQSYNIQVGGKDAGTWAKTQPAPVKKTIISNAGPYAVMGKPTLTADFINKVLAAYHSPAAGKGQTLYNMGVQYGIDPAFALAFFMHESSFGTAGEATATLSLGNLRCYPGVTCIDQDRGGYAKYATWEDGFQAWYELIHNYYVAKLGLVTVDKIIPVYAPTADNNDEMAYINDLKHELDVWHSGQIYV